MVNAPGKNFLKVTGILLIIFGAIGLISNLLSLLAFAELGILGKIEVILAFLLGGFSIVAGVIAVKNCEVLEKASLCFSVGLGYIAARVVLAIISLVYSFQDIGATMDEMGVSSDIAGAAATIGISVAIVIIIISLIIPILYVVGAAKNKKAYQQLLEYPNQG